MRSGSSATCEHTHTHTGTRTRTECRVYLYWICHTRHQAAQANHKTVAKIAISTLPAPDTTFSNQKC